jgi:hypothetical protein
MAVGAEFSTKVVRFVNREGRGWLLGRQQVFDRGIKNRVRDGADDADSCDFIFGRLADDETGSAADAERASVGRIFLNRGGVLLIAEASPECGHVEVGLLSIFQDGVRAKVGRGVEHHGIAHFPELVLLTGAACGHRGGRRVGMEIQREIAADKTDLAGIDVVLLQLRKAVGFEAAAERTLIVRGDVDSTPFATI